MYLIFVVQNAEMHTAHGHPGVQVLVVGRPGGGGHQQDQYRHQQQAPSQLAARPDDARRLQPGERLLQIGVVDAVERLHKVLGFHR